jgi:hypothetical protein
MHAGSAALERLQASIDASELALKDLRKEVSRDSRDLLRDLGHTLSDARRNLTRSRQRLVKDLQQIEHALIEGKPARSAARKRATPARRTTTASGGARRAARSPSKDTLAGASRR